MAPPPLPPLSCVAGSLALSFTGATQPAAQPAADPMTRAAVTPEVAEPPQLPAPPPTATTAAPGDSTATPAATPTSTTAPVIVDSERAPGLNPIVVAWKPPVVPAKVARPYLLRPTDKRFFFQLFVGGSKSLLGYTLPYGGGGMDFKLEGAIGGHGKRFKSLAGAAVIQYRTGVPLSSFTLAPRLQWDKQIVPDHAIYLTTTLTLGYRRSMYSYGLGGLLEGYNGGMAAFGWGVSAIVAERLLLTFRPVNPEIEFNGGTGFSINWDVFGGLGVVW